MASTPKQTRCFARCQSISPRSHFGSNLGSSGISIDSIRASTMEAGRPDIIDAILNKMSEEAIVWTLTCRGFRRAKGIPLVLLSIIRRFYGPVLAEKPNLRAGLVVMGG